MGDDDVLAVLYYADVFSVVSFFCEVDVSDLEMVEDENEVV
jgi:hypothetical protein